MGIGKEDAEDKHEDNHDVTVDVVCVRDVVHESLMQPSHLGTGAPWSQ